MDDSHVTLQTHPALEQRAHQHPYTDEKAYHIIETQVHLYITHNVKRPQEQEEDFNSSLVESEDVTRIQSPTSV